MKNKHRVFVIAYIFLMLSVMFMTIAWNKEIDAERFLNEADIKIQALKIQSNENAKGIDEMIKACEQYNIDHGYDK